jgi:DNA primase
MSRKSTMGRASPRARQRVAVGGHVIELSHLDNPLFPGDGITEGDLVEYYRRTSGWRRS